MKRKDVLKRYKKAYPEDKRNEEDIIADIRLEQKQKKAFDKTIERKQNK